MGEGLALRLGGCRVQSRGGAVVARVTSVRPSGLKAVQRTAPAWGKIPSSPGYRLCQAARLARAACCHAASPAPAAARQLSTIQTMPGEMSPSRRPPARARDKGPPRPLRLFERGLELAGEPVRPGERGVQSGRELANAPVGSPLLDSVEERNDHDAHQSQDRRPERRGQPRVSPAPPPVRSDVEALRARIECPWMKRFRSSISAAADA